ncbi:MAG: PKD domain-containing protein, partial [Bacteroidota bacterium]
FTLSGAHGGVRCGMSICPGDASESDDWLISEQLTLGNTSSISFWVRSPKPGSWGNDSYEVLVSTTNNNPASFTVISGASPVEAPSTWTQHTYSLASYDNQTVYVAVRHVATDKFMFFIDDILINTTFAALNPPVAGFTASATTICAGSSVTFTNTTTGATSYSWSFPGGSPSSSTATNPTVTYSTAGTYTVTLTATNTDGSDAESLSVTVIQVAASANVTNETTLGANDGQIDLTPSGGNAPYTYNWSNAQTTQDLTNLAPGTYNVTVTDANGCTGTGSWTVTQGSSGTPPVAGFTPSATTICVGQSVTFTNTTTGATGYSWSFPGGSPSSSTSASPTVTYTTAGSYTATLTATNTDGSDVESVTINVIDVTVSAISSDESVMGANDGSIDLTPSGGNAPYTYYWSNSATTEDISGLAPGTYNVTVTDANGCTETGSWTILQGPQGIEQPANGMFSLYPNPTTGDVTLQFSSTAIRNIEVYNILGKKMMSLNSNENRQNIDLAGFSKGVYIIQVREKERIITGRVVLK